VLCTRLWVFSVCAWVRTCQHVQICVRWCDCARVCVNLWMNASPRAGVSHDSENVCEIVREFETASARALVCVCVNSNAYSGGSVRGFNGYNHLNQGGGFSVSVCVCACLCLFAMEASFKTPPRSCCCHLPCLIATTLTHTSLSTTHTHAHTHSHLLRMKVAQRQRLKPFL
jgi:hypothetical protein